MKSVALITVLLWFSGCASISDGTLEGSKLVLFTSTPSRAKVSINAVPIGITPCKVLINKFNRLKTIKFEEEGLEPVIGTLKSGFNSATLGNIIAGGVVGAGIDLLGGNMVATKNNLHVNFVESIIKN